MGRLEQIVEEMEGDQLPLETLLARYEEGMRLVSQAQSRLQAAELKIQAISKAADGSIELKSLGEGDLET